jgi:hypothetical protein
VTGKNQLPEEPVRSKGQAILQPDGDAEFLTTIRHVSPSGIGLIGPGSVHCGTHVSLDTHGHTARGVVRSCQPEGDQFYVVVALDSAEG